MAETQQQRRLGLIAKKIGMTQVFDAEGSAIPVTVLQLMENVVAQKKSATDKDGYDAIQIACDATKKTKLSKPEVGHCEKAGLSEAFRSLQEFRLPAEEVALYEVGSEINPEDVLPEAGILLDVTSRPKGFGTAGRIKRWNQHRRTMSHGTKHHRQIGSAGAGTTPGRVFKGKKMPGRDDNVTTIRHLVLVQYIAENKLVVIKGAVPGKKGSVVVIKRSRPKSGWNAYSKAIAKGKTK